MVPQTYIHKCTKIACGTKYGFPHPILGIFPPGGFCKRDIFAAKIEINTFV